MGEIGKLILKNDTANVIFSADFESGIVNIQELDKQQSYQLLASIDVGERIVLQKSDGKKLSLLVKTLNMVNISNVKHLSKVNYVSTMDFS